MNKPRIDKHLMVDAPANITSALDLYKRIGAVAEKVTTKGKAARDSMLAMYEDRLTYTFILGREVASIHYDQRRDEIFFKGQNIRNMDLDDGQQQALMDLAEVLKKEQKAQKFHVRYDATLARILADKM